MEHRPQPVEDRIAGRGEPLGRLPGGGKGEDRVEPAGPFLCRCPRPIGAPPGSAEIIEAQLAASRDAAVCEQIVAQQRGVTVELRGMVARGLIGAVAALGFRDVGAICQQFAVDNRRPGGAEPRRRRFERRLALG